MSHLCKPTSRRTVPSWPSSPDWQTSNNARPRPREPGAWWYYRNCLPFDARWTTHARMFSTLKVAQAFWDWNKEWERIKERDYVEWGRMNSQSLTPKIGGTAGLPSLKSS